MTTDADREKAIEVVSKASDDERVRYSVCGCHCHVKDDGTEDAFIDHIASALTAARAEGYREGVEAALALLPTRHYECEDSFYSCPLASNEGRCRGDDECDCFMRHVAAIRALIGEGR